MKIKIILLFLTFLVNQYFFSNNFLSFSIDKKINNQIFFTDPILFNFSIENFNTNTKEFDSYSLLGSGIIIEVVAIIISLSSILVLGLGLGYTYDYYRSYNKYPDIDTGYTSFYVISGVGLGLSIIVQIPVTFLLYHGMKIKNKRK